MAWDARFRPTLVGGLLDQAVQAFGPRPCVYFMGKRLSFAEIGALSDRVAKGLRSARVGEGVKVGLLLPNTPTFVIFYYGVLKAGGTVVNFNPLYSLEEIEFQIRDSGTKIMVTLDLAVTFEKVEAMLKRGALEKAVVASFPSLLPSLKSVGFKLLQRTKLANVGASAGVGQDRARARLLANDGRYDRPAITPERSPCCNIPAAPPARPRAQCSATPISPSMSVRSERGRTGRRPRATGCSACCRCSTCSP